MNLETETHKAVIEQQGSTHRVKLYRRYGDTWVLIVDPVMASDRANAIDLAQSYVERFTKALAAREMPIRRTK